MAQIAPLSRLVFLVYAVAIGFVSLRPADGVALKPWDKLMHFAVYTVFALLAHRVVRTRRQYIVLALAIIAYSGLLEVGQSFMPGRVMSVYDLLANALGVWVGALMATMRRPGGSEPDR